MPTQKTNGVFNTTLVRSYRCARCWGRLIEKYANGLYSVQCAKNCGGECFLTEHYVMERKRVSAAEAAEVEANYPQLAGERMSPDELKKARRSLFGE